MPESEWTEQQADEPKSGIPMWVWGCGGCGLLTVVLVLVAGGMIFSKFSDAMDPEKVWPKIDSVLAFDERPDGYEAWGSDLFGAEGYFINAESMGVGAAVLIFEVDEEDVRDTSELFSSDEFSSEEFGVGGFSSSLVLDLEVSGRRCEGILLTGAEVNFPMAQQGSESADANAMVMLLNLSRNNGKLRILEFIDYEGNYGADLDDEGLASESAQRLVDDFLEPFNPWE